MTGVPEAVGGVLRKLRADGDLVIAGGEIASDNLRIRSDQIDATLVISATPSKGRYDALFKGRLRVFFYDRHTFLHRFTGNTHCARFWFLNSSFNNRFNFLSRAKSCSFMRNFFAFHACS